MHLFGEKEDFHATLQMLSHCSCHRREGEIMPLTVLCALLPKIEWSKALLRQRLSMEILAPEVNVSESYREKKTKGIE